jgi:hypothetical protein
MDNGAIGAVFRPSLSGFAFRAAARTEGRLAHMVIFGKWSLWAVIVLTTLAIAVAIAAAGNIVIAAALAAVVVVGAIYNLRDSTKL